MNTCKIKNCTNKSKGRGFCNKHYQRYYRGLLDEDGNVLKQVKPYGRKGCRVSGCNGKHNGLGFCQRHLEAYRRGSVSKDGNVLKPIKEYGTSKCNVIGCDRKYQSSGFCEYHRTQYRRGIIDKNGNQLRKLRANFFNDGCKIDNCDKEHTARGFCGKHYAQYKNGIIGLDAQKLRELVKPYRPGTMDGFVSQKQRGVKFILDRYFNSGPLCGCQMCNQEFEFYQICGHHPDPSQKTINAQQAAYKNLAYEPKIVAELDTLVWLCCHCHLITHAGGDDVRYEKTNKGKGKAIDRVYDAVFRGRKQSCLDCGRKLGRRTAIFHHKNPSTKIATISQIIGMYKFDFVMEEIKKCDMLCENCHRKRHMTEDGGSTKVQIDWQQKQKLIDESPIGKKRQIKRPKVCIVSSCNQKHYGLNFCKKHLSQYHNGIIDESGNQLRELYKGGFGKLAVLAKVG
jgi:5-methylcytosine-specific restriction endonuclease McrA